MGIQSGINQLITKFLSVGAQEQPTMPTGSSDDPSENLVKVSQQSMHTMAVTGLTQHQQRQDSRSHIKDTKAGLKKDITARKE